MNDHDKNPNNTHDEQDKTSSLPEEEQGFQEENTNEEIEHADTPISTNEPQMESSAATNIQSTASTPDETKKGGNKKAGFSGLFGGLIGGVIGAAIIFLLFSNNIITLDNETTSPRAEPSQGDNIIETLASDEDVHVSTNIDEVSEAVVGVVNMQQHSIWTGSEEAGTGSGIIYKKDGDKAYVVTNQHVVDGAENVEIVLNEDERLPAKVLGQDALTDLAVLEIDGTDIHTVANFASSSDIAVGETVLAIGNPLGLEFANTVTKGIVSGLNRSVPVDTNGDGQPDWVTEVLQTDAAINPGNSGGALINAEGEVIGINSMKIAQSAVEGIGFAIPSDSALPIMEELEVEGEITRPMIGISTASLYQVPPQYRYEINLPDEVQGGMVVANVEPGSPADTAGLQQFDVIVTINGEPVTSIMELRQSLYSDREVGETLEVEYVRDGNIETVELVLEEVEETEEADAA